MNTKYDSNRATFSEFEQLLLTNGTNENSATFFYYRDEDAYLLKHLTQGDSPSSVQTYGSTPYAVADIHNHPNNTPPSGVDVINIAEYAKENPDFKTEYIYTSEGIYALHIDNKEKAEQFYNKYANNKSTPGSSDMFIPNSALGNKWNDSYKSTKDFKNQNEKQLIALADLLKKTDSGISIMKCGKGDLQFTVISTLDKDGKLIFIKCE